MRRQSSRLSSKSDHGDSNSPAGLALALALALRVRLHSERHALALLQLPEAFAPNGAEVHEHVPLAVVGRDVAEAAVGEELGHHSGLVLAAPIRVVLEAPAAAAAEAAVVVEVLAALLAAPLLALAAALGVQAHIDVAAVPRDGRLVQLLHSLGCCVGVVEGHHGRALPEHPDVRDPPDGFEVRRDGALGGLEVEAVDENSHWPQESGGSGVAR
eukprot:CAMPEP_0115268198 /NCGR_PEP_ID=MMETSP0270-20121206/52392_1 /TAXON_ID=71861 /ORGANISM="Scrippsiella trochoidea, Strain CCMP3099" /LENGTH=213 /DNA_ID=CAMNT_0002684383 /DNA_START=105 /DNA_END=742 /DNA_ORIENTATION=+